MKQAIKIKKTIKQIFIISLIFLSPSLWADNLLDVYRIAQKNDPTLLASEVGLKATSESVNQSLAGLLPQIGLGGLSYNRNHSESKGPFPIEEAGPRAGEIVTVESSSDSVSYSGFSVNLSQEIYNHGSWLSLAQSEKSVLQSNVSHEGVKQDLIVRVAEAYFTVLSAKDSVDFSKAESEAVSKELTQTKQRFEVGLIAMTDVHEAQSRYDSAIVSQITAQNALDNAHEALQQITGQYHYDILGLVEDMPLKNPQPEDINQWAKAAEQNNIAIKASNIGLDIAGRSISIAQSGHYPSVSFSANYSLNGKSKSTSSIPEVIDGVPTGNNINLPAAITDAGSSTSRGFGINVSIPFYSGGSVSSSVRQSKHQYQQAVHNLEAERRRAVSTARSSYLGVVASVSSVKASKQAVISSQSALEATKAGFEVGTRTIVEVLQQTQQVFSSKQQYARARYDYIINTLKLKQATGSLTEDDLVKINQMLR